MKAELKLTSIRNGGLKTVILKVECSEEFFADLKGDLPEMMKAGVLIELEREELR